MSYELFFISSKQQDGMEVDDRWKMYKEQFSKMNIKLNQFEIEPPQVSDEVKTDADIFSSYARLFEFAKEQQMPYIAVITDNTQVSHNFEERFKILMSYLVANQECWNIFNGNPVSQKYNPEPSFVDSMPLLVEGDKFSTSNFMIYNSRIFPELIELMKQHSKKDMRLDNVKETPDGNELEKIDVVLGNRYRQLTCLPYLTSCSELRLNTSSNIPEQLDKINQRKELVESINNSEKWLLDRFAKKHVYTYVKGGLGNMMFQIFSSYGIARNKQVPLIVECSNECPHDDFAPSKYFGDNEILWFARVCSEALEKYVNKRSVKKNCYNLTDDSGDPFLYKIPVRKTPLSISGYLQNKEYFHPYQKDVLRLFQLGISNCLIQGDQPLCTDSFNCMVHIRRGDYVKLADIHRLEDKEYFVSCINNVRKEHPNTVFHFFSDDIEWCSQQEEFKGNVFHDMDEVSALSIMSKMDGYIITNSTFGWWGTYLNPELGKVIVYQPDRWGHKIISSGLVLPNSVLVKEKLKMNPPNPHELTIVTAYYNIKSKFPNDTYIGWMRKMLHSIQAPIVIYTDKNSRDILEKECLCSTRQYRTQIIEVEINDMRAYQFKDQFNQTYQIDLYKDKHSTELYMIWAEKSEMIRKVAEDNPFKSDVFLWCDIGYFRDVKDISTLSLWPSTKNLEVDRVNMLLLEPFKEGDQNEIAQTEVRLGGGCIILGREIARWFADTYFETLARRFERNAYSGNDQFVLAEIAISAPDKFNLIRTPKPDDWFYFVEHLKPTHKCGVIVFHKNINKLYSKKWVQDCVNSILNQSFKSFTIYELNYGKSSKSVFTGHNMNNIKHKMFTLELHNHVYAMNFLMEQAATDNCDYVFNVNLDDIYEINRFETELKYAVQGNDIVSSYWRVVDENDTCKTTITDKELFMNSDRKMTEQKKIYNELVNFNHNIINHSCVCYSKNIIDSYRYSDDVPREDLLLWQQLAKDGIKFKIIETPLIRYRIHSNSICGLANSRKSASTMISILTPVYNGIEFMEEMINSVKNQTYQSWEQIIGINGHEKDSEETRRIEDIVKNADDTRIRVMWFPTKGKALTLNEMVKHVNKNSDWIALIDADDLWLPRKLEHQVKIIGQNKFDVIGTNAEYFGDKTGRPGVPTGPLDRTDFMRGNTIINSSVIIPKKHSYWNNLVGIEDYDMWLTLRLKGLKFFNCPQVLVKHRIHGDSAFNANDQNNIKPKIVWN